MASKINIDELQHDYFNVVVLPIIIILDFYYVFQSAYIQYLNDVTLAIDNEKLFLLLFLIFNFYLVIDIIWILLKPTCVKGSMRGMASIVAHHITTCTTEL
jgi:hypothetical protein